MNCGMNASSSDALLRRRDPLRPGRCLTWSHLALSVAALVLAGPAAAHAQLGGIGFGAVGGISIDADGIVRNLDPQAVESLARERRQALAGATDDRGTDAKLRKVSLAKIVKAVTAATTGQPLPSDVLFLGGLERITHVFVDTECHDIILAGPADAIAVDAAGTMVAATSGRPLLQLEDLVVAMRAIDAARSGGNWVNQEEVRVLYP